MCHISRVICTVILTFLIGTTMAPAEDVKQTDTNFDNYKPLAAAIKNAGKLVLYEGLPHQMFEKKALDDELKAKKTITFGGFPFYAVPLALKEADGKTLTTLYCDPKTVEPFGGEKKCGGFHPDFCIEWQVGKETYRALICFGCRSMKSYGPKSELYCDLTKDGAKQLGDTLKPYRKNRPKTPGGLD